MGWSVEIRHFERDDLDGVVAVENEVFAHEAMPAPTFVQFGEIYRKTFLVAVENDQVLGYVLVSPTGFDPERGLVIAIGVKRDAQNRGIGRALMERVLAESEALGMSDVELTVDPDNEPARRLYESLGFHQVGEVHEHYFGEGEHRFRLHKRLVPGCDATDDNLQAESATSVAWSNLLVAITGAALAGLIAVGSVNAAAYWYVMLALLGSFYSSQYYANVSGVVGRLHRNHDPERLLIIGNALSEYLSFYPLVLAMPLVIALLTQSAVVGLVALVADLFMFAFYQLGSFNVESRQAGHASSLATFVLMAIATTAQVAAVILSLPLLLNVVCGVATVALIGLTLRGVRAGEC